MRSKIQFKLVTGNDSVSDSGGTSCPRCPTGAPPLDPQGEFHPSRFMQNIIKLSAAVHELSCVQRKNSDENITVRNYRADSEKKRKHQQ